MNAEQVRALLDRVAAGKLSVAAAEKRLRASPAFLEFDFATLDNHRELRTGHPEIVYGPGKTPALASLLQCAVKHVRHLGAFTSRPSRAASSTPQSLPSTCR